MTNSVSTGVVCASLGLVLGGLIFSRSDQSVSAQPPAGNEVWEYSTVNLEPGNLQAKLTEMGQQGWQVFSIVNSDFALDQTAEANPRLVVQRQEVTAKRLSRN